MTLPRIPHLTGARRLGPFRASGGMSQVPYTAAEPVAVTLLARDTFDRADSTPLGTSSGGQTWASVSGSLNVIGERAGSTSGLVRAEAIDVATADHAASAVFAVVGGANTMRLTARLTDAANYIFVNAGGAVLQRVAGVEASIGSMSGGAILAGQVVTLRVSGANVTAQRNGTTELTGTTTLLTGTRAGLYTVSTTVRFDTFEVAP